jgi:DNA-binding CsgD family transcriptional regulator
MDVTTLQQQSHARTAMPPGDGAGQLDSAFAWRVLDEIDYGMLLVSPSGALLHANHLGREELSRCRFLRVQNGRVDGVSAEQTEEIMRGVQWAAKGRRQMLTLRNGDDALPVASVPMLHPFEGESASVLLILGRQAGTSNLAVTFFSRIHGLTPAEESVLKALCDGMDVREIAMAKRVSECTVRTQLRWLRGKTGVASIRLLVQRVAALPPVVPLTLASEGGDAQLDRC